MDPDQTAPREYRLPKNINRFHMSSQQFFSHVGMDTMQ